jgi:hypothetical protein
MAPEWSSRNRRGSETHVVDCWHRTACSGSGRARCKRRSRLAGRMVRCGAGMTAEFLQLWRDYGSIQVRRAPGVQEHE